MNEWLVPRSTKGMTVRLGFMTANIEGLRTLVLLDTILVEHSGSCSLSGKLPETFFWMILPRKLCFIFYRGTNFLWHSIMLESHSLGLYLIKIFKYGFLSDYCSLL